MTGSYWFSLKSRMALFHVIGDRYWWYGLVDLDKTHRKWSKRVKVENKPDVEYTFVLCCVDEHWDIMVDYYNYVHEEIKATFNADTWPGIHVPHGHIPGLVELDRLHVTTE